MRLKKQLSVLLVLSAVLPAGVAARPHTAYASTIPGARMAKSCKGAAVPLSEGQMAFTSAGQPIDGICFIVGVCTGMWPIGTLICGPTAIGCVIHYWQS